MMPGQYPPATAAPIPMRSLTQIPSFWIGLATMFAGVFLGIAGVASSSYYSGAYCLFGFVLFIMALFVFWYAWSKTRPPRPVPMYGYPMPAMGAPVYSGGAGGSYMVPVLYKPSPYHQTVNIYPHDLQWKVSGGRQTGQVDTSAAEQFCQSCGAPMTGERCGYCGRPKPGAPAPAVP